jgi:predicted PurR-regulated permease PerM
MGWAIFMGAWGLLVVSSVDNFLKPYLISRGSSLPFVLVFLGAVGGILTFGFIGLFLGPTLLAIGYSLLNEWSASAVATGTPPLSSEADDARQIGEIGASSGQRVLVQSREKPAKY